jgi:hypothetical protein
MAKPVHGSAAKGRTSGEACGILIRASALLSVLLGSSKPLPGAVDTAFYAEQKILVRVAVCGVCHTELDGRMLGTPAGGPDVGDTEGRMWGTQRFTEGATNTSLRLARGKIYH